MTTIRGYDSTTQIFERMVPGNLSDPELEVILQRLVCRHLTDDEIVSASLRRNHRGHTDLLEVHKERGLRTCGVNPFYVADVRK